MDTEFTLKLIGVLILIDVFADLWRIWNQSALEKKVDAVYKEIVKVSIQVEEVRQEFNGKSDQLLKTTMVLADMQGYKRAMDEQVSKLAEEKVAAIVAQLKDSK